MQNVFRDATAIPNGRVVLFSGMKLAGMLIAMGGGGHGSFCASDRPHRYVGSASGRNDSLQWKAARLGRSAQTSR